MRRINVFLACLLALALLIPMAVTSAQGGVPLPPDAGDAYVLYPDLLLDAPLGMGTLQQRYVLLAKSGNILSVTATSSEPGLIARVELVDASGIVLTQQAADPTLNTVAVNYEVAAEGWYYVTVSLATAPTPTSAYTLALTGTTRAIFDALGAGAPPVAPGAHIVAGTAQVMGNLEATPIAFMLPLEAGDSLALNAQGASQPKLRFTQFDAAGNPAQTIVAEPATAGGPVNYSFVSDKAQWVKVDVEPTQMGAFALNVTHPRASIMAQDLGAGIAAGAGGSAGAASGELCAGIPARFAVGDIVIVSPEGDNILLTTEYSGGNAQSLGLITSGMLLEITDVPVCHNSTYYQAEMWFWPVFSPRHNLNGWVADGRRSERWLCPENNPSCNIAVECVSDPYDFAIGDKVVVSQTGDDLQIGRVAGPTDQIVALASWNDQLNIVEGPVCFQPIWQPSGVWYWKIFSTTDNTEGWVVQGTLDEIWLCPLDNPTCDQ